MTDAEFLAAFEACTLREAEWTHRAHIRMAWLYLRRGSFAEMLPAVRDGIRRYNASLQKHLAYHETITQAYLRLVDHRLRSVGASAPFEQFCEVNPDLLERGFGALLKHYRRETLLSDQARADFVQPDLQPFPMSLRKIDLFEAGEDGYAHYRIPGIIATARGTLLAYCEGRRSDRGDWGSIDIMLRRSTDGGQSWDAPRKIVEPGPAGKNPVALAQGLGREGEVTVNNPVAIADTRSGIVHFLYCIEYARCFYLRSDDDGQTFSRPLEITPTLEQFWDEYDWRVLATGPGHGIQLRSGRLLVPVWLSTGTGGHAHRPSCVSVIYSDNGGETWERGEIVAADPEPPNPSETVTVELEGGRVMLNIRNEGPERRRAVSVSPDGASGWSPPRLDAHLPEPVCMGSILRYAGPPRDGKRPLLFANPDNPDSRERRNLTVRVSWDEGATWPSARRLEPGPSGYSDLACSADGTIYCFYERGRLDGSQFQTRSLCLGSFDLDWVLDDRGDAG